ncbi:hypothetical protein GWI33_021412 [Rhynchophorus ferrugineus]|uniref:Uncharacterized protein n=1 Tax=Rhynchophorus ferrugineus TaxID=354439 RepID=A0A834HMR1_RHYFE|nr:hypothetical protein GWI33_021412 [Rhynchophorus ferrugineus]
MWNAYLSSARPSIRREEVIETGEFAGQRSCSDENWGAPWNKLTPLITTFSKDLLPPTVVGLENGQQRTRRDCTDRKTATCHNMLPSDVPPGINWPDV